MDDDPFDIVGAITEIETIASGRGIRRLKHLRKRFGGRHWRKLKGIAAVRITSGSTRRAEVRSARGPSQGSEDQAVLGLTT